MENWPYVLDYSITLKYKDVIIRESRGEFYQDFGPKDVKKSVNNTRKTLILNDENIKNFEIDKNSSSASNLFLRFSSLISNPDDKDRFGRAYNNSKSVYYLPPNVDFEVEDDLILSDSAVLIGENTKFFFSPLVKMKANLLVAVGEVANPIKFNKREGLSPWYGLEVKNGYLKNVEISNVFNNISGALHAEDSIILILDNVKFLENLSHFKCDNCHLSVKDVIFDSNFWYRASSWGINLSNSSAVISDLYCSHVISCMILNDSKVDLKKVEVKNTKAAAFEVIGPASQLKLSDVKVRDAPAIFWKQNFGLIEFDRKGFNFSNVNMEIIDMDKSEIYSSLENQSIKDFIKQNRAIVSLSSKPGILRFKTKNVYLEKDLIIPKGVILEIEPGTTIELEADTNIFSFGKIEARGTESQKIKFISKGKRPWGTIVLKGAAASGIFENCEFNNGSKSYFGFDYSGSLTAHYAERLEVRKSIFENSHGDDSLNCKNTFCIIEESIFKNNYFDSIDFDFAVYGSIIRGNQLINSGNDAIDLSQSNIKIFENEVKVAGDKCVSVGEESNPLIFNNLFSGCKIGIESKDDSNAMLINNTFLDNQIQLNAYLKKQRFLVGGEIKSYNSVFQNPNVGDKGVFSFDDSSSIFIDNNYNSDVVKSEIDFYDINVIKYGIKATR
jgi:parallel beta-helix repeat protein